MDEDASGERDDAGMSMDAARPFTPPTFAREVLSTEFWAEGASFGDFDRDGDLDVVAGPFWYEGPAFTERHAYYDGTPFSTSVYSDNFFAFPRDFDGDGWTDILIVGFPGRETFWYENPQGKGAIWKRHLAFARTDNEAPVLADVTGDGVPELVCNSEGAYGYAAPDSADPRKPWVWHRVSDVRGYGAFTHGMGVGDVNGDGRVDLVEKDGWWEQPSSLAGDPVWKHHPVAFARLGGAQMFAFDVDGDGDADVVTSLAAHAWGFAWYEQRKEGARTTWQAHVVLPEDGSKPASGVQFGELHALATADVDGDGLLDVVTGKRWWSHGPEGDKDEAPKAVVYWFRLVRDRAGARFDPYLIDDDSGVGTQVVAADVTGDGRVDVVAANKKGVFVLRQR